jgi:hypothetical protein
LLFCTDFARSRFSRESSGQRRKWVTLARVALFSLSLLWVQTQQSLAVCPPTCGIAYTVDSTGDGNNVGNVNQCTDSTGHCTLRAAIQASNAHSGVDGIFFNIPTAGNNCDASGNCTINLGAALPDLSDNVNITGPGADKLTVKRDSSATQFRIFNVTTPGTVTLSGLTIRTGSSSNFNNFTEDGGGIQNFSTGTVNVTNCTLSDNSNVLGGGIGNSSTGIVNVTNSTLNGNSASGNGGAGIYNNNGTVNVTNCTLSGNYNIGGVGGGILNSNGTVNITNSTLSANSANGAFGGGIYNGGTVTITNSTLSANAAPGGGGIYNLSGRTVNASSTIIANNTGSTSPDVSSSTPDVSGSFTSQGFNLIGKRDGAAASFPAGNPNANNDIVGTLAAPIDPKLDPAGLLNNGGPTQTIALLFGSPAIDKGNNFLTVLSSAINNSTTAINVTDASNIPAGVGYTILIDSEQMVVTNKSGNSLTVTRAANSTTAAAHSAGANLFPAFDQRGTGFPRTFNDPNVPNASGGDGTDIGAFEVQTAAPTPTATPTAPPTATPTGTPSATPTATPSATPTATPTPTPGSLGNISTRLQVGTGNNVLFAGFIIQGSASKTVLIRSAGPSLTSFGVPGALGNPQLELHDANNTIGTNDNWQTTQLGGVITSDQVAAIQNSGATPLDPAEPALIATLAAGQYTAIVQGVGGTQGIATVEVYDLSPNNGAILANISTRGFIQTGDNVMIGGFIIVGHASRVVIRATGPSLIPFGIDNALTNPQLELHDTNGTLAGNDDWQTTQLGGIITSDQSAAIQNSGLAPGNSAESAIIATLAPGNYTAIAQGVNGGTGVGLVEVFALP